LNSLPVGYQPYFGHVHYRVQESNEAFLVMLVSEPSSVVEETKWSSKMNKEKLVNFVFIERGKDFTIVFPRTMKRTAVLVAS